jgi:hypothetical protein
MITPAPRKQNSPISTIASFPYKVVNIRLL